MRPDRPGGGGAAVRIAFAIWTQERFMDQLLSSFKSFVRRNKGQDLLEYALLVALIALVSLGAVAASGGSVGGIFGDIAEQLGGRKSNCSSTGVTSSDGTCQ